jgi:hypothetical protein
MQDGQFPDGQKQGIIRSTGDFRFRTAREAIRCTVQIWLRPLPHNTALGTLAGKDNVIGLVILRGVVLLRDSQHNRTMNIVRYRHVRAFAQSSS